MVSTVREAERPLAELRGACFAYPGVEGDPPRVVLRDFDMTIGRGESVALLGPNGSGKTTIMRILNGLEFLDSGEYRFDGEAITKAALADKTFARRLHQRIGFVFQNSETQLFCPSVGEEIAFGPAQMGLPDDEIRRRTRDVLRLFELERFADRASYRLSGGEKKRVAIACCMSLNPDLLVLDEPTDGLDERNTALVVRVLNRFVAAGKTILVSTHHHDIVEALHSRRIAVRPIED
ncbi:ABC transporter ATP-binding protein [Bifidobacterium sp. 82T24]|uniref:ATP-binding cassette domain-containing protein n=1 Tax=Bifidobacterium saimiriisciurei TaxID=2661627 RepID=A0ABX0CCK9_9BIFI|nr:MULTISPECIES: ABC transporter ATP-binding protein [Bifidobacterium]MBW3088359.1 ABC transporter ATP-binding protein [Bifidobacterium pluvialisilvae]NEG97013.1 ATP-binding cassette domain-containing protein [Bifidobacterium sp. SMB2]NEH12004.1 ATP-binding cassette domain-containing protein [Bifidobacterium saimiriisciurei]